MTQADYDERKSPGWTELELRLAILQVLRDARKKNTSNGGASGKILADILMLDDLELFKKIVKSLLEIDHIELGERVLKITPAGEDFLTQTLMESRPQKDFAPPDVPELRIAILEILLHSQMRQPPKGGASAKMLSDILDLEDGKPLDSADLEFCLWYLKEKGYIAIGERLFTITESGVEFLSNIKQKRN